MRFNRLHIENFAAIRSLDVEFGPGLNVFYGPNDLGKSTVVAAIRLCLLLPHASTEHDQYVGWTGGEDPLVELTFQTETQRIWRIQKRFGKNGLSLLQESRDGQNFEDTERGRKVDGKLREILCWGIPEPGGTGGAKGLPTSFLATALLSAQDDVGAIFDNNLQKDPIGSGRDQIAAALQAVAQDPLFLALLRETQSRRDEAYTDKGAKKTARGSVFKVAAERLNEARNERDKLQKIVSESESVETQLRELTTSRAHKHESLAEASRLVAELEKLAALVRERAMAAEGIRLAKEEVLRIQNILTEVELGERKTRELAWQVTAAEEALNLASARATEADAELKAAEETSRTEGSDPGSSDTIARQQLEIRKSRADQAVREAQQRVDSALDADRLVTAASVAEQKSRQQLDEAGVTLGSVSEATAKVTALEDKFRWCDLLECALDVRIADQEVISAQTAVDTESSLQRRLETLSAELAALAQRRAAITVPAFNEITPMRTLERERNKALSALDVGFVVTVNPKTRLDLRVRKDHQNTDATLIEQPIDIEANADVELSIADIATVHVQGGRRETQNRAQELNERWSREVEPHLIAACVSDLEGLEKKITAAQALDTDIKEKNSEMDSLRAQISGLSGSTERLQKAVERAAACLARLGYVQPDSLASDIAALGSDSRAGLRKRRDTLATQLAVARSAANDAEKNRTLADERARQARLDFDSAIAARDTALIVFPEGLSAALSVARAAHATATTEKEAVSAEFASLEQTIQERKNHIDAALSGARAKAAEAKTGIDASQRQFTTAKTEHAAEMGRLVELRKQRDAVDLAAAQARLNEAAERYDAFPVPDRIVADEDLGDARRSAARLESEVKQIEREIQKTQGALEQVGGAVARDRLRDAIDAFELAERQERETEAEYEAWKLLLEQMNEADAAQASNLGEALVPAITERFRVLTQQRYETLKLSAQLGTEGILVSGVLRPTARMSVGTREQLSALYRLSLAEYLRTAIVLDDQLVQSDENRMDWFRALLTEKARNFQILIFTCRPSDYLLASALVPVGSAVHTDTDDGLIRAVDLGRALHRC
jgi:hypothetical protein